MKKASLFIVAATMSMALMAQTTKLVTPMSVETRFGIRGGVNLANLHLSDVSSNSGSTSTNSLTSFNGGLFANIPLGTNFRIQPEVDFSGQGAKLNGGIAAGTSTSSYSYTQKLNYITVPVMAQFLTNSGFFIQTGPQLGYLITAKIKDNGSGSTTINEDNKSSFNKFDFAWGAGLGYLSRIGLGIDARYNFGITDVINSSNSGYNSGDGKLKNQVAQISLIYQFGAAK